MKPFCKVAAVLRRSVYKSSEIEDLHGIDLGKIIIFDRSKIVRSKDQEESAERHTGNSVNSRRLFTEREELFQETY